MQQGHAPKRHGNAKRAANQTNQIWSPTMNLQEVLPAIYAVNHQQQAAADAQSQGYRLTRPSRFARSLHTFARTAAILKVALIASAFTITGCSFFGKTPEAVTPPAPVAITTPAKPTALTPSAQTALAQARTHVAQAAERATLWPSATKILKQAEAAALQFDSPLTTKLADEVSALCAASVKQAGYAPVQVW